MMPPVSVSKISLFCVLVALPLSAAAPVSLNDAYLASTTKNESLGQAQERINQAQSRVSQLTGGIMPSLSFQFGHLIQPLPADPAAQAFSPEHQTTANFNVTQPLFRGLREWKGLSQARHLRTAEERAYDDTLNRLYRQVAATYLQILSYEQDLKNLNEQATIYESRLKDISGRTKRGESNQSDLVTAEATSVALQAEIRLIQGQLEGSRETLQFLTGVAADAALTDPQISIQLQPIEKYLERIEERPDVKSALERHEAADEAVTVAWGAHLPTADAFGNYYLKRPGFVSDLKWDVGVKVIIPLFEGGTTQAKVSEAVSVRKSAELELEKTRRAARQEIRTLYKRLVARDDQLKHLKRSADLSRKNTTLLQRDYRRGLARNIDVQLALTEFRVAQRTFDQAHFASQLEMLDLQGATASLPLKKKETTP